MNLIIMPKDWLELKSKIFASLKGKKNPRTNKPYSEDELYAIAVSAYKKKYGRAPKKEENPNWYCDDAGREVRENVNLKWNEVLEFDNKIEGKDGEPLKINGIAINETITKNKIKYVGEELEKAVTSLIDKPILNSHNNDDVREVLGKVIDAKKVDGCIKYFGEIDSDEKVIVNKIKKGYVNKVSIGAQVKELIREEIEEGGGKTDEVFLAKGINFNELSLVCVPGDDNSSISLTHALSESFNVQRSESNELDDFQKKEDTNMNEDELKKLQEKIAVLEKEKADLAEKVKTQDTKDANAELVKKIESIISEKLKDVKTEQPKDEKKEDKKEEVKTEEKAKEDEKKDKKEDKDESKGLLDSEDKKEEKSKEDLMESMKDMVIEHGRDGVSFFRLSKTQDFRLR